MAQVREYRAISATLSINRRHGTDSSNNQEKILVVARENRINVFRPSTDILR
jgi:hypothetical protein